MAKKPDKSKLVCAAKELNDLIKPDPPISTEGEVKDMLKQVTSAAALLEPGDCISKDTGAFLSEQGINHKASVGGGTKADEKETPSAATKKIPGKKAAEKKPPAPKKAAYTRFNAIADVLKKYKGGLDKADLVKKADEALAAKGGKSNEKETTWAAGVALQVLKAFGQIEDKDGKYALIK